MCGIAGMVTANSGEEQRGILERMTGTIRHRGPDDSGFFQDGGVLLGHRRLSIIDLATGRQPMSNEDGSVTVVYNGEIFNHADLRPELERAGHCYSTRADTEAILHAWEEYGRSSVTRFRGMFAFALWDRGKQTLFCARDRLGIKPFYYYWDGQLFAFASEIKALFEHPRISPALEESLLAEYLAFGYISEERTLFAGIRKLMPGHTLQLRMAGGRPELKIRRYWDAPAPEPEDRPDEEWIRECRSRLEETVRMRLMSDVPLGMFLSGGIDSSVIAALMKTMVAGPVKTFSVGYGESDYSELGYARQAARSIGTQHHEVVIGKREFFNALPRLIWHEDEPITWPSSVSLYFVSRLAADHVKVVLTGEGSDELFGGYGRYRFQLLNQACMKYYGVAPQAARRWVQRAIAGSKLMSGNLRRKLQHTFLARGGEVESIYLDNFYSAFPAADQGAFFRGFETGRTYTNYLRYWDEAAARSFLGRMLYADQKTYLVELLMKQDQMSMACSIESRVPFLDHPLMEFSTRVPDRLKIRNGTGKYILKKAVEDLLPAEILHRKKMGFPTPLKPWLAGDGAQVLLGQLQRKDGLLAGYVNRAELERLLDRHRAGSEDATDRIWRLLNLQVWADVFLEGRRNAVWEGLLPGDGG